MRLLIALFADRKRLSHSKLFSKWWTWCSYHKTLKQWLLQSSWAPFSRTDWKFSNTVMPSWQWNKNMSANDSHLFLPKCYMMGMLLQPHTPGASSPRSPSKTQPSKKDKKIKRVRISVVADGICKQFMQSSIAPSFISLVFFPCGPNTTGPNKETEMRFNEVHKSVLFAANSKRHLMRLQILPSSFTPR